MLLEDRIRQSFNTALDEARGTLEADLQATLAAVHEESERSRAAAVAEARSAAGAELTGTFDDEKAALTASHDAALQQVRSAAEAELAAVRAEADRALAAVRADRERDQQELLRAHHHADACAVALADADQARGRAADAAVDVARRALDGVKALDDATSLIEVLDALTAAAPPAETGRAAMLVAKGDRLIGWRTTGFGAFDSQPRTIETSSDNDALMRAVATSRPVVIGSGPASSAPSFAGPTAIAPASRCRCWSAAASSPSSTPTARARRRTPRRRMRSSKPRSGTPAAASKRSRSSAPCRRGPPQPG